MEWTPATIFGYDAKPKCTKSTAQARTTLRPKHSLDKLFEAMEGCAVDDEVEPLLEPTEEEKLEWEKKFFCMLFSNASLKEKDLETELKGLWLLEYGLHVEALGGGILMMQIEDKVTRDFLIKNSLWCIKRACIVVRGWEEGM